MRTRTWIAQDALIVVDLQNAFMVEEVAVAIVPVAVEIVPNVNNLAAAVQDTAQGLLAQAHHRHWTVGHVVAIPAHADPRDAGGTAGKNLRRAARPRHLFDPGGEPEDEVARSTGFSPRPSCKGASDPGLAAASRTSYDTC